MKYFLWFKFSYEERGFSTVPLIRVGLAFLM